MSDESSMKDPLCHSSFGSMVSLDYATLDTSHATITESAAECEIAVRCRFANDIRSLAVLHTFSFFSQEQLFRSCFFLLWPRYFACSFTRHLPVHDHSTYVLTVPPAAQGRFQNAGPSLPLLSPALPFHSFVGVSEYTSFFEVCLRPASFK